MINKLRSTLAIAVIIMSVIYSASAAEGIVNQPSNFDYFNDTKKPFFADEKYQTNLIRQSSVSIEYSCSSASYLDWKDYYAVGKLNILLDQEDWIQVDLDIGKYQVYQLNDPSADVDLYIYDGCEGNLIKYGVAPNDYYENVYLTISQNANYKIKIFEYSGDIEDTINWKLYIFAFPEVTLYNPATNSEFNSNPYFSWTSKDYDSAYLTHTIYIDDDSNPWSYPLYEVNRGSEKDFVLTEPLSPGTYYWGVKVNDGGRDTYSSVRRFSINNEPLPPGVALNTPQDNSVTFDKTPYFSWTSSDPNNDILTNTIYIDDDSDPWTYPLYKIIRNEYDYYIPNFELSEGTYYWGVKVQDGTYETKSNVFKLKIDTTPPITFIDSGPAQLVNSKTALFTFSASEPGSTFSYNIDNGLWSQWTSNTFKTYNNLNVGKHTFSVRSKDVAGNINEIPASWTWTITDKLPDLSITSDDISFGVI